MVTIEKGDGFVWRDKKLNFDVVELGICGTSKWRCPKGHCSIWGNLGAESRRCHWIQTKGTVLRTVAVLFRAWYHSLDQKDHFSRHQGMDRNSSILCYSFTASFYPLELSLLIILICFCFNCFSGSLFTPGWNLQIPRCHLPPRLCPQKTADWTRPFPHWVQVFPLTLLCPVSPADATKPTSLLHPCPSLGFPIWSQGFGFSLRSLFFLSFSKHPYTTFPISVSPWLPVIIWGFQLPGQDHIFNEMELWKCSRKGTGCDIRQRDMILNLCANDATVNYLQHYLQIMWLEHVSTWDLVKWWK